MSFYFNHFPEEYQILWAPDIGVGKRPTIKTFVLRPNSGRTKVEVVSFATTSTFDLSGSDESGLSANNLYLAYTLDAVNFKYITIDLTASVSSSSAVTPLEIVNQLNNDTGFSNFFTASVKSPSTNKISIKTSDTRIKFFVVNAGAERVLKFNKYAGIAQMPDFCLKDKINYNVIGVYDGTKGTEDLTLVEALSRNIEKNTVANPTIITCPNHGLKTGTTSITIGGSNCTPTIDGARTATYVDENTFSVAVNVTAAGTKGYFVSNNAKAIIADAVNHLGVNLGYLYSQTKSDVEFLDGDSQDFYATHAPAAATAATITIPALANKRIKIRTISWSYDTTPTGGALTVVSNGVTIMSIDVPSAGSGVSYTEFMAPENKSVVITLASGAGSVVGRLNAEYYYSSDE